MNYELIESGIWFFLLIVLPSWFFIKACYSLLIKPWEDMAERTAKMVQANEEYMIAIDKILYDSRVECEEYFMDIKNDN